MSAVLEQRPEDLSYLVGATIHSVEVDRDHGEEFLALTLTTQEPVESDGARHYRVRVQVWQDEEGNGPGYLALVAIGGEGSR